MAKKKFGDGWDGDIDQTPTNYVPDPKKHLIVSLVKSGIRIIGYLLLLGIPSPWAIAGSIILVGSEIVGVVEEMV